MSLNELNELHLLGEKTHWEVKQNVVTAIINIQLINALILELYKKNCPINSNAVSFVTETWMIFENVWWFFTQKHLKMPKATFELLCSKIKPFVRPVRLRLGHLLRCLQYLSFHFGSASLLSLRQILNSQSVYNIWVYFLQVKYRTFSFKQHIYILYILHCTATANMLHV